VNREAAELWSDAVGGAGTVIRYGHWGRPVLVFPSEQGKAWDFENNGMVAAVTGLLEEGRLKLYCVDSYDAQSWSSAAIPVEERAQRHGNHLNWLRGRVSLLLVCGQGQWEDTTGSLPSTKQFAEVLASKEIRHELDLWGHDVPHDWPSWRAQLAHHMPRFC
jgi:esterase/lipase superfamily enzyme